MAPIKTIIKAQKITKVVFIMVIFGDRRLLSGHGFCMEYDFFDKTARCNES